MIWKWIIAMTALIGALVKYLIKSSCYTFSCISRLSFVMFEVLDSKAAIEFSVLASLPESPRSRLVILSISSTWRRYFKHSLCFVQEDSTYESNNSIRFSNQIFGTFLCWNKKYSRFSLLLYIPMMIHDVLVLRSCSFLLWEPYLQIEEHPIFGLSFEVIPPKFHMLNIYCIIFLISRDTWY